jgi:hypothetical protein
MLIVPQPERGHVKYREHGAQGAPYVSGSHQVESWGKQELSPKIAFPSWSLGTSHSFSKGTPVTMKINVRLSTILGA